jgi:methyl-accepting chemotaxis protein
MKDELLKAVTEASGSVAQIQVSTESMGKRIRGFDRSIEESTRSIGRILRGIEELDEQIEGQGSMVEEVTASVTEMLSSLDSMGRITERDRALAEGLVRVAERGHRVIEEASDKIAEIPRSVGAIREMAEVIRGVAASTDLLAMNAAIEAAHAGEAGRGFAVVADEIRKLSEASGASSDDIARSIESIIARIGEAMGANAGTSEAFAAIDGKIREVASSMDELFSGLGEIRQGSEQILQAMTVLQERSMRVKEGSSSMEEASSEIGAMTEELGRVSSEVSASIGEIGDGMSDIDRAIDTVAKLAERVGDGSNRLDEDVGRFKTA